MADNNKGRQPGDGNNRHMILLILVCVVLCLIMASSYGSIISSAADEEITYDRFVEMVKKDEIREIQLDGDTLEITPNSSAKDDDPDYVMGKKYHTLLVGDENGLNELLENTDITYSKKDQGIGSAIASILVSVVLPLVIFFVFIELMMRSMGNSGALGVGKSKAKTYVQKETGVTFADVAGEEEAKDSLKEVVDFLHNPARYTTIGAKLPKGVLLVGPPGTGKTLLAKAVAGEAHVPFFSVSGSEFVEMFVGVGASRVRDLFEEAKKQAPCIIFIDEIDAIGKTRDSQLGGNDEREQTLNQILSEMDGFDSQSGILILAATNRPEILDPALLRPGRFDRRVIVDRPDLQGRIDILRVHARNVLIDDTVDFHEIALSTSGAVGSDLANMVNEAAILAVKNGRHAVCQQDLRDAVEVVLVGREKKDRVLSKEERLIVSYHEVGHALVNALQKHTEPVQKITIVPRTMGALGYVMQVPEEEKYLNSRRELEEMVVGYLGGRAAEEIVFGDVTTGAANDIEKATGICRSMVTQYGMSDKFGLMALAKQQDKYLTGKAYLDCGDETATEIDHEVMQMLNAAYAKAKELISANRDVLDRIAGYLNIQETITGKEFMQIMNTVISERGSRSDTGGDEPEKPEEPAEQQSMPWEEQTAPEA